MQLSSSVAPRSYPGYVLCAPAGDYGSSDPLGALADGWAQQLAVDDGEPEQEPTSGDRRREAEDDPNEPDGETDSDEEEEDPEGEEEPETDSDEEEEDPDSDEEDEDDEPARSDTSDEDQRKVKVTVNGQEQEVTMAELRAGYSRTQDYTQKTQNLAQQRRQLQEAEDSTEQTRQGWLNHLQRLEDVTRAKQSLYSEAELQRLREEDSYAYGHALDEQRKLDDQLTKIRNARQHAEQESSQQAQKRQQRYLQAEFEQLQSKLPEWQDPSTRNQDLGAINQYARELGFSDQELANVADHRMYLVLRDAAKYRASQQRTAKTKDKVAEAKKQAKPGKVRSGGNLNPGKPQSPSNRKTAKAKQSHERFKKSGSVRDAASWLESQL